MNVRWAGLVVAAIVAACGGDDDGGGSDGGGNADGGGQADSGTGTSNTLTFISHIGLEQEPFPWVAVQDGDEPWAVVTSLDGEYVIELDSERWGLAYLCQQPLGPTASAADNTYYALTFFYGTLDEVSSLSRTCRVATAGPLTTVNVEVQGLEGDGYAIFSLNAYAADLATVADNIASEDRASVGPVDIAVSLNPTGGRIERLVILPVDLEEGVTTDLQVDVTDGITLTDHSATATGTDADMASIFSNILTERGTAASNHNQSMEGHYGTAQAEDLRPGDLHKVLAQISESATYRVATTYFHEGGDVVLDLPEPLVATPSMEGSDPYVRMRVSIDELSGTDIYHFFVDDYDGETLTRSLAFYATSGYLGDANPHEWTQPDLSDVSDWDAGWALPADKTLRWSAEALSTTGTSLATDYLQSVAQPNLAIPGPWDGDTFTRSELRGALEP